VAGADRMTIEEVVRKVLLDEHADVVREAVKAVVTEMMELEVSELIGAELGERRPEDRATHRNGYRRGGGTRARARSSCRSRRSGRAVTSRAFSSRAGAPSRRCWR
jgi:transposase-like protein